MHWKPKKIYLCEKIFLKYSTDGVYLFRAVTRVFVVKYDEMHVFFMKGFDI